MTLNVPRQPLTRIQQAEDELAIAAYAREVLAVEVAQTLQFRVVHAQLPRKRTLTHDELVRTTVRYVFLPHVVRHAFGDGRYSAS